MRISQASRKGLRFFKACPCWRPSKCWHTLLPRTPNRKNIRIGFRSSLNVTHLTSDPKFMLVDAMDPIYRAHFAYEYVRLQNSVGQDTTILFGFLQNLCLLLECFPLLTHLVIVFDPNGKTFRHDIYPYYKAHRESRPQEIKDSMSMIKEVLNAANVKWLSIDGVEADDVIATFSDMSINSGLEVVISSKDKDFFQLLKPGLGIFRYSNDKFELFTNEEFEEKYQIEPKYWCEVLGLMGDASDNIPGVRNIGLKRALSLVRQYKTIEDIYKNLDQISPKGVRAALQEESAYDNAMLSLSLVKFKRDLMMPPARIELNNFRCQPPQNNARDLVDVLEKYDIRSIATRLKKCLQWESAVKSLEVVE